MPSAIHSPEAGRKAEPRRDILSLLFRKGLSSGKKLRNFGKERICQVIVVPWGYLAKDELNKGSGKCLIKMKLSLKTFY